jgi:hypothetical protein
MSGTAMGGSPRWERGWPVPGDDRDSKGAPRLTEAFADAAGGPRL